MPTQPDELSIEDFERRLAERRKFATRRILISVPIALLGEVWTFGAMLVATDAFTHPPRGELTGYAFVAGLILAIPPALISGYMAIRHWAVLRPIMIAMGVMPWMPIPAVAIWLFREAML